VISLQMPSNRSRCNNLLLVSVRIYKKKTSISVISVIQTFFNTKTEERADFFINCCFFFNFQIEYVHIFIARRPCGGNYIYVNYVYIDVVSPNENSAHFSYFLYIYCCTHFIEDKLSRISIWFLFINKFFRVFFSSFNHTMHFLCL
jgi:hypothetical protein